MALQSFIQNCIGCQGFKFICLHPVAIFRPTTRYINNKCPCEIKCGSATVQSGSSGRKVSLSDARTYSILPCPPTYVRFPDNIRNKAQILTVMKLLASANIKRIVFTVKVRYNKTNFGTLR